MPRKLKPDECLNALRLPGRLTTAQAAIVLGVRAHDMPALIEAFLIKPLGASSRNAAKFYMGVEIEKLRADRDWMETATEAIREYWQRKNKRARAKGGARRDPQAGAMMR
jgi:hypothetical protein